MEGTAPNSPPCSWAGKRCRPLPALRFGGCRPADSRPFCDGVFAIAIKSSTCLGGGGTVSGSTSFKLEASSQMAMGELLDRMMGDSNYQGSMVRINIVDAPSVLGQIIGFNVLDVGLPAETLGQVGTLVAWQPAPGRTDDAIALAVGCGQNAAASRCIPISHRSNHDGPEPPGIRERDRVGIVCRSGPLARSTRDRRRTASDHGCDPWRQTRPAPSGGSRSGSARPDRPSRPFDVGGVVAQMVDGLQRRVECREVESWPLIDYRR
jgi:hypothetical protein